MSSKQRLTANIDRALNKLIRQRYHKACKEALENKMNPPSFSAWFNDWLKKIISNHN